MKGQLKALMIFMLYCIHGNLGYVTQGIHSTSHLAVTDVTRFFLSSVAKVSRHVLSYILIKYCQVSVTSMPRCVIGIITLLADAGHFGSSVSPIRPKFAPSLSPPLHNKQLCTFGTFSEILAYAYTHLHAIRLGAL